jgi:hypothetical protein
MNGGDHRPPLLTERENAQSRPRGINGNECAVEQFLRRLPKGGQNSATDDSWCENVAADLNYAWPPSCMAAKMAPKSKSAVKTP